MFLYSLMAVSDRTTKIVTWISAVAVMVLLLVIAAVGFFRKTESGKYDSKRIAFAGVCVACSFVLALLKFKPVKYGGSITLASFAPVLIYAYVYGPSHGFIVGLIHGLLNFLESPYILTPATFILDYLIAFASIGVMGFFGKMPRKERRALPVVLGCISVFAIRFAAHYFSGVIFFLNDSVWVTLPSWAMQNAFIYSLIYQCVYIPWDALITTMVLFTLVKTGVFDKLAKRMRG